MFKNLLTYTIFILALLVVNPAISDEILVPDDAETIQEALEMAGGGDVILISPGTYNEDITIPDVELTITSLYHTTGNEAYIDSTIIEGTGNGSVVTFENIEDDVTISGLTITGGGGRFGAGINITGSSPNLHHLKITGNVSQWQGGGINMADNSEPIIENCLISENSAPKGGGICIYGSHPTVTFCVIANNTGNNEGGGVYIYGVETTWTNVTFTGNTCDRAGNLYMMNCPVNAINCIFWNNQGPDFFQFGGGRMSVDYSVMENGQDEFEGGSPAYGDNNIQDNPLFVDVDAEDFHLQEDSPCIDTGDPDSPEDIDGSRADMGGLPFLVSGMASGYVYNLSDESPIENAMMMTSNAQSAYTDENGYWVISPLTAGLLDITASAFGFNDSTLTDVEVEFGDTLEFNFSLKHPAFAVSVEELSAQVEPDDTTAVEFSISNEGNGELEWNAEKHLAEEYDFAPWTRRNSIAISEIVEDSRIEGVIYANERYYVSGSNRWDEDEENLVYILDNEWNLVTSYPQAGESNSGYKDMAFDGELIWASGEENIFGFMPNNGEVVDTIVGPNNVSSNQALAWDGDRELLWTSGITSSNISGINLEGEVILEIPRGDLRIYGLAYWQDDPDGCPLYIFSSNGEEEQGVYKVNPEDEEPMPVLVQALMPEDEGSAAGAFITDAMDSFSVVFMNVANDGADDRVDTWQLDVNDGWIDINLDEGTIEPDGSQEMMLILDAVGFVDGIYEGSVWFWHNAADSLAIVPFTLTVETNAVYSDDIYSPNDFAIESVYPNPFNPSTTIQFNLPMAGKTKLTIFDISGRQIATLIDSRLEAGRHNLQFDAGSLPSSVYMIRLVSGQQTLHKKMMLIK